MSGSPIQRILVPVDLSSCSGDVLRLARGLAAALGASIEVLHVVEAPGRMSRPAAAAVAAGDPAAAREALRRFLDGVEGAANLPLRESAGAGASAQDRQGARA